MTVLSCRQFAELKIQLLTWYPEEFQDLGLMVQQSTPRPSTGCGKLMQTAFCHLVGCPLKDRLVVLKVIKGHISAPQELEFEEVPGYLQGKDMVAFW